MKIYIPNILPSSLQNKLTNLTNTFGNPVIKIKYEVVSKESGIHWIMDDNISHIESTFHTNYELIKGYNNIDLLVDKTNYKSSDVFSQLPVNYILSKIYEFEFKLNNSKLSLIIECFEETQFFEKNMLPINFYFHYNETNFDLKNSFFQDEFNMFLSHLI